jgi:hypothetical protein
MTTSTTQPSTHLTTGWEPDLADADSLCLTWVRHWADQVEAFARSAGGRTVRDERHLLADYGRPASFFNSAVLLAPPPDRAAFDALLDDIEAATAAGTGTVHLWSLWPTPDLRERGWELDGHPPLLVRPPGAVPDLPAGPPPARVQSAADLAVWETIVVEGYPMPDLQPCRPGTLVGPDLLEDPRFRFWLGHDPAGTPVSATAQFVARDVAGFALGVTLPGRRGHGHWARQVAARLRAEPGRWHVGVFSDDSRRGAERAGFVPVIRHTLWHRSR